MKIPIFMIFKFVMVVATWATKALEDGKITAEEGLELVAELAAIIGVPLELSVPNEVKEVIENITDDSETGNVDEFLEASKKVDLKEPAKD
ncbi:hypothetical protein ES703_17287 [subsurface metagenome]